MKKEFIGQLTFLGLVLLLIILSGFVNQAEAQDYPFDDTKWIIKLPAQNNFLPANFLRRFYYWI